MFKQYDPGEVLIYLTGLRLTGFANGTFLNVERNSDSFTEYVGADGMMTRVYNRDKSGICTLTLQGSSPANDILSNLLVTDELTRNAYGNLLVEDLNGNTLIESPYAWVRKFANYEAGMEESTREWVIACAQLEFFVGGSISPIVG